MKKVSDKVLSFFLLTTLLCSCVDGKYDLGNIDDSGGLSPSLVLPIGTLNTNIIDFIRGAGTGDPLQIEISADTVYIVYKDLMSLNPVSSIPGLENADVITDIPAGIRFAFDGGTADIGMNLFKNLAAGGSILILANPIVYCTMRNYIGADVTIDINSVISEGSDQQKWAKFDNGNTGYSIDLGSAPEQNSYSSRNEIFDRTNGQMHELFSIAPELISFDFSVNLAVPNDGNPHFIVKDKYVDMAYEVRIPLTFGPGTQLVNADTLAFDLSGEGFINNIDNLTLWIDYTNSLRTTVDLDVIFLDGYRREIQGITKLFHMDAAATATQSATGLFPLTFDGNEFDNARKAQYAILKSVIKTDNQNNGSVNIRPADCINLKLSAHSKINI
jgi:hypothetical protein